jgi:hypothetical protein
MQPSRRQSWAVARIDITQPSQTEPLLSLARKGEV